MIECHTCHMVLDLSGSDYETIAWNLGWAMTSIYDADLGVDKSYWDCPHCVDAEI